MGLLAGYLFSRERKEEAEKGLGVDTSRRKKVQKQAEWWTYRNGNLSWSVFKFFKFLCETSINKIIIVCHTSRLIFLGMDSWLPTSVRVRQLKAEGYSKQIPQQAMLTYLTSTFFNLVFV